GSITLAGAFSDKSDIVDKVVFSDGTFLSAEEVFNLAQMQTGTDGNDEIRGSRQNEKLYGLDGDDHIDGFGGNDYLDGGNGNDTLVVGQTSASRYTKNTLVGGQGDDMLKGYVSSETYIYSLGDGHDVIDDVGSIGDKDLLRFGDGITREMLIIKRLGNDVVIEINSTQAEQSGSITFKNGFTNTNKVVDQLELFDGSIISAEEILIEARTTHGSALDDSLEGTSESDRIFGHNGNDIIRGGFGNDYLDGGAGNDEISTSASTSFRSYQNTLVGGLGNDKLIGSYSAETYVYDFGDGHDVITDKGDRYQVDKIQFGTGITKDNVEVSRDGIDIVLKILNADGSINGSIRIERAFTDSDYKIELIQFADGSHWSDGDLFEMARRFYGTSGADSLLGTSLDDLIFGLGGNDTLDGGLGSNLLDGGEGDDVLTATGMEDHKNTFIGGTGDDINIGSFALNTYVYNLGDGNDTIKNYLSKNSVISFGSGITQSMLEFKRKGDGIEITVNHTDASLSGSIFVEDAYLYSNYRLKELQLFDGSVVAFSELVEVAKVTRGDANDNEIYGTIIEEIIYGGGGNDIIYGNTGLDELYGEAGNDIIVTTLEAKVMNGGAGDDVLRIKHDGFTKDQKTTLMVGSQGNDTYEILTEYTSATIEYSYGDGHDVVVDAPGKSDKLVLMEGIEYNDVTMRRLGNALIIEVLDENGEVNGSITLVNQAPIFSTGKLEQVNINGQAYSTYNLWMDKGVIVQGTDANEALRGTNLDNVINGEAGNDVLSGGLGDDILDGGEGNDTITSKEGNDTINGGAGDDNINTWGGTKNETNMIQGGLGDDTVVGGQRSDVYIYNLGDGNDTYTEHAGTEFGEDKIIFGEGISQAQVTFGRVGHDILIKITNTDGSYSGSITIKDGFYYKTPPIRPDELNAGKIESIEFVDGSVITMAEVIDIVKVVHGTAQADRLTGTVSEDTIKGYEGDDYIIESVGDDIVFGGDGNDTVYASAAEDYNASNTFIGGKGNDKFVHSYGNDTYVYHLGDGHDTIIEAGSWRGEDTLLFGEQINADNLTYRRVQHDLIFEVRNAHDEVVGSITIEGEYLGKKLENVRFSDGTELDMVQILQETARVNGSDIGETLLGGYMDETIYGYGGDDLIRAGSGSDIVFGGEGNDNIYGGSGHAKLFGGGGDDTINAGESILDSQGNVQEAAEKIIVGGLGDDTLRAGNSLDRVVFEYQLGDGSDVIERSYESNTLKFGNGITSDMISVRTTMYREKTWITIDDGVTQSQVTINGGGGYNPITGKLDRKHHEFLDNLEFTDGTVLSLRNLIQINYSNNVEALTAQIDKESELLVNAMLAFDDAQDDVALSSRNMVDSKLINYYQ
ncbi:calcium-binding protein, partial [Pseudoalteromonas sp. Of7M-16]|uniref:calcium-binding protein n=1 Tax=Pseudoalteromonas sp. Of7M-16 TaxID=2917756 RepID=UPI0023B80AF6